MSIVYRTTNPSEWGTGQGSDLAAAQIDMNFWILYSSITALQDHALTTENQIDYFSVVSNQLYVTMMNHEVFGPFTLPVSAWNFRGQWQPATPYSAMDVVTNNNSAYLVLVNHTSQATFDAGANDGMGHNYYGLLISSPFPTGGTVGQVWQIVASTSPEGQSEAAWANLTRLLSIYIPGTISIESQVVWRFVAVEDMTIPAGATNSRAAYDTPPTTSQTFSFYQNNTFIGTLEFTPSPDETEFVFADDVTIVPGDILTLVAPGHTDIHMTDVSITLVATLP